jgi:hypothetical protein
LDSKEEKNRPQSSQTRQLIYQSISNPNSLLLAYSEETLPHNSVIHMALRLGRVGKGDNREVRLHFYPHLLPYTHTLKF